MKQLDDPSAWLCHYTRADTAFAHIIPRGRLLMNPYSKMRDPFENKEPAFHAAGACGDDGDGQMALFSRVQAEVAHSRNGWCLLSLTQGDERPVTRHVERRFRCPWSRARMWEQYADNHAGACLVFDREALLDAVRQDLGGRGVYQEGAVEYTTAGFAASAAGVIQLDDFAESSLKDDVALHVERYFRDFFFLKTADWATEFEYRFVFKQCVDRVDLIELTDGPELHKSLLPRCGLTPGWCRAGVMAACAAKA